MHTVLNALVLLTRASSTQELNLNSILLLCRQSASCPLFILLRKFSVIFRNASLLLLLCSSSSPPTPSSSSLGFSELSGNSGSRTFLNFFSSFLTKFTMFSSSSYNSKDKGTVSKIMYTWVSFKRFGIFWRLNNNIAMPLMTTCELISTNVLIQVYLGNRGVRQELDLTILRSSCACFCDIFGKIYKTLIKKRWWMFCIWHKKHDP